MAALSMLLLTLLGAASGGAPPRRGYLGLHSFEDVSARRRALAWGAGGGGGGSAFTLTAGAGNLTAAPAVLWGSAANVTLTWSGVASPTPRDWLGVWCADALNASEWLDYVWASEAPGWASGGGRLVASVFPARCGLVWRYVSAGLLGPSFAAAAAPVGWAATSPYHLRLSLGSAPGTALLSWTSDDGGAPAAVSLGEARGGPYPRSFAAAPAVTYGPEDLCGAAATTAWSGTCRRASSTTRRWRACSRA